MISKEKLKLLKVDQIFDKDKIDPSMILDQFKKIRVNPFIPIEDFIQSNLGISRDF